VRLDVYDLDQRYLAPLPPSENENIIEYRSDGMSEILDGL
jgi:hypothetical protein